MKRALVRATALLLVAIVALVVFSTAEPLGQRVSRTCARGTYPACNAHDSRAMTPQQRAKAIRNAAEDYLGRGAGKLDRAVTPLSVDLERGRSGKYWVVILFSVPPSSCTFGYRYPAFYEGEPADSNTPEMWAEQLVASLHEAIETRSLPNDGCPDTVWMT
jgi:hypothetical protein